MNVQDALRRARQVVAATINPKMLMSPEPTRAAVTARTSGSRTPPAGAPFTGVSGDPTGRTMTDVLSSPFVTEGSDNLCGNTGGITTNDVERFSVLRESPLDASNPANVAVSIVERGGNDAFKLAAATAVDGAGAPAARGPIVSVPRSAWGPILTGVTSTVLQQLPGTTGYRPSNYAAAQTIAGVSISLTDLGVVPGQPSTGFPSSATTRPR